MTFLAIDVGNTRLKWALYEAPAQGSALLAQGAEFLDHVDRLAEGPWAQLPVPTRMLGCVVAGDAVKRRVQEQMEELWDVPAHWVVSSVQEAGLRNGYDHPSRLGCDRWVAMIGARHHLLSRGPARPLIVVMVGTAVTVEAVDTDGTFLGGLILPFAVQPRFHHPTSLPPRYRESLFVGSYSKHIHDARREWQDMVFAAAAPYGLTIIDRNSARKAKVYRYPDLPNTAINPAVAYDNTGDLYRQYSHSLNVNTVTDSPSMFSRRLIEIMACGRLPVTNPSLAVTTRFEGMCEVIETHEQADALFAQLAVNYTPQQEEMMRYASNHVLQNYNYDQWLQQIVEFIEL